MIVPELFVNISDYLHISYLNSVLCTSKGIYHLFEIVGLAKIIKEYESIDDKNHLFREACKKGHIDLIRYINYHSTIINDECNRPYKKALTVYVDNMDVRISSLYDAALVGAVQNGHLRVVEYLCHCSDDISLLAMVAGDEGHLDIIKYLHQKDGSLLHNFDIRSVCEKGHLDIVKYYVECGAEISEEALQLASREGYLDIVEYLCVEDSSLNVDNAIMEAIIAGHLEIVKCLHRADMNHDALLQEACRYCHINIIDYLCENGADPSIDKLTMYPNCDKFVDVIDCLYKHGADLSTKNNNLLKVACKYNLKLVQYLHETGVDLSASGNDPIKIACRSNKLAIVKYLCENGADPLADNNAPIRKTEDLDIIKYLCKHGADPAAKNNTPIRNAMIHNDISIVKYLRGRGADPFADMVTIKRVCKSAHMDIIKYLCSNGASQDVLDCLIVAATSSCKIGIIKYLLYNGANPSARNNTPIRTAIKKCRLDIIKYLHKKGANPFDDMEMVMKAYNDTEIIEYLCSNGTPKHVLNCLVEKACNSGDVEFVKRLHRYGADLTECGNIITIAAKKGYMETVRYLTKNGVDVTIDDNAPIKAACENGHYHVMKYLHINGAGMTVDNDVLMKIASSKLYYNIVGYLYIHGSSR